MRTLSHSIWLALVLFTCNSGAAVTPAPTSSPTPTIVDKIADPRQAQGREQNIEYSSRAYAVAIDYLSIKLGQLLGPWSLQDLFWQITPAKMIAGTIAALITLIFWQILRLILHRAPPHSHGAKARLISGFAAFSAP